MNYNLRSKYLSGIYKNIEGWHENYLSVCKFVNENQRLPKLCVSKYNKITKNFEVEKKLYDWMCEQKILYIENNLEEHKIGLLGSLFNWSWTESDLEWNENYGILTEYIGKNIGLTRIDSSIYMWILLQKTEYKINILRANRIIYLENIVNWEWVDLANTMDWYRRYSELYSFVLLNGREPSHKTERSLRAWVRSQIELYNNDQIIYNRAQLLLYIGRVPLLSKIENEWWDKYNELLRITESWKTGKYIDLGKKITSWIYNQRIFYTDGLLSKDKIYLLEKIYRWRWVNNHDSWDVDYKIIKSHMVRYKKMITDPNINIGERIVRQLINYKNGLLDSIQIMKLESIEGWSWSEGIKTYDGYMNKKAKSGRTVKKRKLSDDFIYPPEKRRALDVVEKRDVEYIYISDSESSKIL